jgi:hypothetical protein
MSKPNYRLEIIKHPITCIQTILIPDTPCPLDPQLVRKRVERMNLHLQRNGWVTRLIITGLLWVMATASSFLLYSTQCGIPSGWCKYDVHVAVPSLLFLLLIVFNIVTHYQALRNSHATVEAILKEFHRRDPSVEWILKESCIEICGTGKPKIEDIVVQESHLTLDMSFKDSPVYSSHSSICF